MSNLPTPFEMAALSAALAGSHPALELLRTQLEGLRVTKREHTGVGFFAELAVAPEVRRPSTFPARLAISDVDVVFPGVATAAGIVLFVDDGALTLLEGFTVDGPWPEPPEPCTFVYRDPARRELSRHLDGIR